MSGTNRSRLQSYLKPIEIKDDTVAAPLEVTPSDGLVEAAYDTVIHLANKVELDEPSPPPRVEAQQHIFEKLVERLEALAEPAAPMLIEPKPAIDPILLEKLVDRLEALADRPTPPSPHMQHLYELHQSVVATLTTVSERLGVAQPDHSMALLEHMTRSLAHQQAEIVSLAESQRDIIASLNESQVAVAQVIVTLVDKVNALMQSEPVINVPAPIVNMPAPIVNIPAPVVNVQVKEGGVITKTIERDERGLISRVTEAPSHSD